MVFRMSIRKVAKSKTLAVRHFVLQVAVLVVLTFSQPSLAASREDLLEGAKREGQVVVYLSMNVEESNARNRAFEAKYPFIKVREARIDGERLFSRILAEEQANKHLMDVVECQEFYLHTFKKRGILGYYLSPEDRFYPKEFKEEGYWITAYLNPYVVAYNSKLVSQKNLPTRYEDLLKPEWKGKMTLEPTKADWLAGMLQIMGREPGLKFMRALSKQNMMVRPGHSLLAQLVAAGESLLDINMPASTANRVKEKGAPIDWIPVGPVPGIMNGIGIASKAPNPNAARVFADFVLSREGQKMMQGFGRWVARSDISQEQVGRSKGATIIPVDPALGEKFDEYIKLLAELFPR